MRPFANDGQLLKPRPSPQGKAASAQVCVQLWPLKKLQLHMVMVMVMVVVRCTQEGDRSVSAVLYAGPGDRDIAGR